MLSIMYTWPVLIITIIFYFTYRSNSQYKNGMLFAVKLPDHATHHPQLQHIQTSFTSHFRKYIFIMLLFFLPVYIMYDWQAIQTLYFFIWITTYIIVINLPFRKAMRATLQLKREQDWYVGKKQLIQADLRAAQLKNKKAAPFSLFIIPFVLGVLLFYWLSSESLALLGIASISTTLIFTVINRLMLRSKSTIYSQNSEINVALNQAKRRSVSYLYLFLSIIEVLHFYLIAQLIVSYQSAMSEVWLIIVVLYSAVPIGITLITYRHIRSREQHILSLDSQPVYSDDDEYWTNGFTYHNPYDKSLFVPKRVGIGETINTGTTAGKIILGGSMGIIIALVIGVSFLIIRSELTSPVFTLNEQQGIDIQYPMYSFSFTTSDVEELLLVDDYPSGVKTNGESTSTYARGHFRLRDIGKTRLYIYKNNPPYIRLKLSDQYVFYNDQNPEITKQLYKELQQVINPAMP